MRFFIGGFVLDYFLAGVVTSWHLHWLPRNIMLTSDILTYLSARDNISQKTKNGQKQSSGAWDILTFSLPDGSSSK